MTESPAPAPENATQEPLEQNTPKRKSIYKWVDRALNTILVLAIIMWAIEKWSNVPKDAASREQSQAQRLDKAAAKAFGLKETTKSTSEETALWEPPSPAQPLPLAPSPVIATSAHDIYQRISTEKKPVILFVHASWCQYCNKLFPLLNTATSTYASSLSFVALSIDNDAQQLASYWHNQPFKIALTPFIIPQGNERSLLTTMLAKKGLQFTSSIPYMAIFYQQIPVAQISGFVEPDKLKEILDGAAALSSHLKESKPKDNSI